MTIAGRKVKATSTPVAGIVDVESFYRTILDTVDTLVVALDREGRVAYFNRACEQVTGYSAEEVLGRNGPELFLPPEERYGVKRVIDDIYSGQAPNNYVNHWVTKDGSRRLFVWTNNAIFDNDGAVRLLIGTGIDITERQRLQQRFSDAIESMQDGFALYDADDRLVQCNARYLEMWAPIKDHVANGVTFREFCGLAWDHGMVVGTDSTRDEWLETRMQQHAAANGVIERQMSSDRWVRITESRTSDGGIVTIATDITAEKKTEAALRESEQQFKDYAESASDWFWEMGPDLRITYMSDRVEQATGRPVAWHIGKTREELAENDGDPAHWRQHRETLANRQPFRDFEYRRRHPNGHIQWFATSGAPRFDADGRFLGYRGAAREITSRRQVQQDLETAQRRLQDAIASSPAGIMMFDANDRLVNWNDAFIEMFPHQAKLLQPGVAFSEFLGNTVRLGAVAYGEATAEDWARSRNRSHRQAAKAVEVSMADGRWFLISERRTSDGGIIMICTDITAMKQAELELKRSNAELDQFASAASHDLQEPLRKVLAFGDLLQSEYAELLPDQACDYIANMQSASSRMRQLINDLLSLSRISTDAEPFATVDLTLAAHYAVGLIEQSVADSGGRIEFEQLCTIEAAETQMVQLLQNLLGNALKYHRDGVPPVIRITSAVRPRADICELRIEDNGIGFDEKHAEQIFGVFQRLHGREDFEGTGIGLAICKKIVERHGGRISATSTKGAGSVFLIELPIRQTAKVREHG